MKIICIGRNYVDHAKELNNPVPKEPVFFCKPDSALLASGKPFMYPKFTQEIHHEIEVVVRINRTGKHIAEKFAHKYYEEIGLGIDFTARDIQRQCKEKGLPWEKAKGFDGSAPLGAFFPKQTWKDVQDIPFSLKRNGTVVQAGNTSDMLFSMDAIIAYVSQFFTLKIGDLIYTGTPAGVGPITVGDDLEGFMGEESVLRVPVR